VWLGTCHVFWLAIWKQIVSSIRFEASPCLGEKTLVTEYGTQLRRPRVTRDFERQTLQLGPAAAASITAQWCRDVWTENMLMTPRQQAAVKLASVS